jgi:Na+-exporting ATPase
LPTAFAVLSIAVIKHDVFKHTGISWMWGIVFIETSSFSLALERV